jgi:hypothetical protein
MITTPPHLTLEELATEGDTSLLAPVAARHLAECAACRARSGAVAAVGVRFLVSRCQPPPGLIDRVLADTGAQPTQVRYGWFRGMGRRADPRIVLGTAAAVVLAGVGGYGLTQAFGSSGHPAAAARPGGTQTAALTATGCPGLDLAGGTLQRVSGPDLVLATAGGRQVTVMTSAATRVIREVTGTLSDITAGAHVFVSGTAADGTISARTVGIVPGLGHATPSLPSRGGLGAQLGLATGTVTDAGSTGFTVTEQDGTRVHVATSPSTPVITTVTASLGQLQAGRITSAVGTAGPGGTLTASTVEQDALPAGALREALPSRPSLPSGQPVSGTGLPRPSLGAGLPTSLPSPGTGSLFSGFGCAPDAITSADLLALSD